MSSGSLQIPIYQLGHRQPYQSAETKPIPGIDGANLGEYSVTVPARIKWDCQPEKVTPWLDRVREVGLPKMLDGLNEAARIFRNDQLPTGGLMLGPDEYCRIQSRATGMPVRICEINLGKIERALRTVEATLRGHLNTWRADVSLEDLFMGKEGPGYKRQSALLGGVWPSNTSGVYQLLPPGLALGPGLVKPGSGDFMTPIRIREACMAAGLPVEAIGIYPGDGEKLGKPVSSVSQRYLVFGGADTVAKYEGNVQAEIHGPGCSKIIIGRDMIDKWEHYLDIMVESVLNGSGRGCIACSAIYAPGEIAEQVAQALADRIGSVPVLKLDDPSAELAAFTSVKGAEGVLNRMRQFVEFGNGRFVTPDGDRAVECGTYSVLRPVVAYLPKVPPAGDLSPSKFEIPGPAVLVVNSDGARIEEVIGSTLVCTTITGDHELIEKLADGARISRLNRTPIPTTSIHLQGEAIVPLEGVGMPRFLFDTELGKPKPTY